MTVYDGSDALLYFFAHIARESNKQKEIGGRVICVMDTMGYFTSSPDFMAVWLAPSICTANVLHADGHLRTPAIVRIG